MPHLRDFVARERQSSTPLTITTVEDLGAVLEQVRADGYALVDQELEIGLPSRCRFTMSGTVVASVNTSMQATLDAPRRTGKKLEAPVKKILRGAAPAEVASPGALMDTAALDDFVAFARARAGEAR
ncbi:IclR family transcriptional regulator domain-containing protein [Streptomyces kebangsaanensis]|uniref:IclR family transcriptional regulator domain-containing protein n=1 Tax=Streptomyces kebangsaanensis TaxID=864058 RepID=UPI001F1E8795|nr:IclR family transcriptional regulator C-terminal domain-containing protein [Streptomyces kebangsaanensis]